MLKGKGGKRPWTTNEKAAAPRAGGAEPRRAGRARGRLLFKVPNARTKGCLHCAALPCLPLPGEEPDTLRFRTRRYTTLHYLVTLARHPTRTLAQCSLQHSITPHQQVHVYDRNSCAIPGLPVERARSDHQSKGAFTQSAGAISQGCVQSTLPYSTYRPSIHGALVHALFLSAGPRLAAARHPQHQQRRPALCVAACLLCSLSLSMPPLEAQQISRRTLAPVTISRGRGGLGLAQLGAARGAARTPQVDVWHTPQSICMVPYMLKCSEPPVVREIDAQSMASYHFAFAASHEFQRCRSVGGRGFVVAILHRLIRSAPKCSSTGHHRHLCRSGEPHHIAALH